MKKLNVLIGCESSGTVREAFRKLGHNAWSCDLLPADDNSAYHYQGDMFDFVNSQEWDIGIFHPPCTYLCSSGLHWNSRVEGRQEKTEEALVFVQQIMNLNIPSICIENPIGCISTRIRRYDQKIQPYEFGDDASKSTCLWLKNLPLLKSTGYVEPRIVNGKKRWSNQTDSGQNRLTPSETRWKERSKTYQGIADAMAQQYSKYVLNMKG